MKSNCRLRDAGLSVGELPTGRFNGITDVRNVRVGHVTLRKAEGEPSAACTGVTAILPHEGNWFRQKVPAATHVINGFGKTTGLIQVDELGVLESPILLTNTFSVPAVTEGTVRYMTALDSGIGDDAGSLNVVVGECNDSYLNDMRGFHIRPEHARAAIEEAQNHRRIQEGCVGAGTGMICFGWKGGIGTASRRVKVKETPYHIGVLVLSNFGVSSDFTLLGTPVGRWLHPNVHRTDVDGSIMIVVATDLPMNNRQLKRLAKRASFGLARTGSIAHHGSGDIVIAFSNAHRISHTPEAVTEVPYLAEDGPLISRSFRGVVEATEEAILNSLFTAEITRGRLGRTIPSLPVEEAIALLKR
ncbi:aminopeptidase [Paludifilum halophilum]|uniref:Aminopeptidase n=2 Tax=Paludifilum halophilum TaxID=1642702 RepID=A0A235BCE8_9BACL|nr:aminopeptidase [Paludifilum halophilum]